MEFTPFEALARLAHRVAVSEEERNGLTAAFLQSHGSADEKKRFYTESESDKKVREDKEKFDTAVAAEVQRRNESAANEAAVKAAADQAQQAKAEEPKVEEPVNPQV